MSSSIVVVVLLLLVLLDWPMEGEARGRGVPAIYVFGDSTVDVGNNNFLFGDDVPRANFSPYGMDFPGGKPNGRFTNGYNAIDYLSMMMGFKQSPPAYLATADSVGNKSLRQANGVNFASAACGVLDSTSPNISITVNTQLTFFGDIKWILTLTKGESRANHHLARSIFIFSVGSNDIFEFYITFGLQNHQNQSQNHGFVSMLTLQLENQLKRVYELGGRKFVVFGLGQIGCVETARSIVSNHKCINDLNKLAVLFNQYMKLRIQKLQSNFPGMKISYINTYDITLSMETHPEKYGLKIFDTACCGNGVLEIGMTTCLQNSTACANRNEYFLFDYIHPTQEVYHIFAKSAFYGSRRYVTPMNVGKLVEL